ncbi:23S rRNA (adenine(2030)-N(6))-methyltransferase RlmJ [Leptothrix discophora]|uniref:Ribosomal RNA large subunit methyltransferase J n=1 Tax=Leptothrix discophora TaxID=89 RepID=A0ABT9FZH8_LEPDI|nr:23S rRNA (adenine(2030)-N(6))-methyltransferase RlmJ [Leptothrix discophora]MDP4299632.1 23S rRNA (adenine(2030)-N(6))-methyltransferase RlmJ [Leptothrix discophora]
MLAYRHAFHAGNHADVLKHLVLVQVLRHMALKDKPYRLVDTHAGGGGYALDSVQAQKKGEYLQGIARIWDAADTSVPEPVADYLDLVRAFNARLNTDPDTSPASLPLRHYPGSPAIAQALLRPMDQLRLFELHPTEHAILADHLGGARGVQIAQADGFESLKGQLPPPSRRGVVLMDPSYELVSDYGKVIDSLRDALRRFAEGVYVVWYPQVSRVEASQLPRRLQALAPKGWLHARISVQQPDAQGFGLIGSGMFIINPPYTLHAALAGCLPWLVDRLAQHPHASYLLDQHVV